MKSTWNISRIRSFAVALAAGVLLLAGAGYSQDSRADPCAGLGGTYDLLIAAGSCEIGDKTFSGFTFLSGDIVASDITYAVINGPTFWGFQFQFSLFQSGDGSEDFFISYDVTCNSGLACIDSIHASIVGGSSSPDGAASLAEHWVSDSTSGDFSLFAPGLTTTTFDITPTVTLHVEKDIQVACDIPTGSTQPCQVTMSSLTNTVDQVEVPEPGTLALLASGLVGLGWIGRRRRDRA